MRRGFQPGTAQDRRDSGRGEEAQQCGRFRWLFRRGEQTGRECRSGLYLGRQRPTQLDAGNDEQLADLLHRQFDRAAGRVFGGEAGVDNGGLGVHLGFNAQALDQRRKVDPAGADARIGD